MDQQKSFLNNFLEIIYSEIAVKHNFEQKSIDNKIIL